MMKRILFILSTVFTLLACNNDESVNSLNFEDSAFSVVGRWYAENNTDNPILNMFGEYVFTADGVIYIDEYRRINGYRRNELQGVYSINGNNITTGFDFNEGGQSTSSFKVTENLSFSASFHRFSEDYTLTFQRVVGEIALMVGDTLYVSSEALQDIEAYTSKSVEIKSYSMNDPAIASVNEDGFLLAKLIGVTYLKVETSIGIAVLKVSVADKENLWNDFSKVLGRDFDEVLELLGKHYVFKSNDSIRYYYDNPYVDSVGIYRHDNVADSIVVSFRGNETDKSILDYLESKLVFVKDTLSCHWYTDNSNYLFSTLSAKYYKDAHKIIYTRFDPEWDDRIEDYGLSFDELVSRHGNYSDKEKWRSEWIKFNNIKNDFIAEITYHLNPMVYKYSIIVNMDIPMTMIDDYINRKFLYWDVLHPHTKNIQINGKEMFIFVSVDEKNYRSLNYSIVENN